MGCGSNDDYSSPSRATNTNEEIADLNLKMESLSQRISRMQGSGQDCSSELKQLEKYQRRLSKLHNS